MATYNVFSLKCTTENAYKTWTLLDSEAAPTTCPTNTAHTIDANSVVITKTINDNIVTIREETVNTGGNFMCETVCITAATGPSVASNNDFTWPFPISVLSMELISTDAENGDAIDCCVAPNTIIGILTVSAVTGATGIYVSSTVTQNILRGYYMNLFNGVNTHECGRVLNVDKVNSKVTFETALSRSFLNTSPTYIRQTVYVVKHFMLGAAGKYIIGSSKIGGSYVPSNTIVRVIYTNNDPSAKTIKVNIEYLY